MRTRLFDGAITPSQNKARARVGWAVLFAGFGGVGSAIGAALILILPAAARDKALPWLVAYATGALLGAAFLALIPKALTDSPVEAISATILAGVIVFFLLERLLLWRHSHRAGHGAQTTASGALILIGDALHNFADGAVIAAAFLVSFPFGVAVSLAVVAHEIPQEVGDFAILLDNGYSARRAFFLNTLAAAATIPGAIAGWIWLPLVESAIPYVLAASAASFIYIAVADLIPTLHERAGARIAALQFLLMLTGVATIALLQRAGP